MMSDEIDAAQEREQLDTENAIRTARRGVSLEAIGICHNCGEPLDMTLRFCDENCRDDWDCRESAGRRNR